MTDIVEHTPRNSLLAAVVMLALFALKSISVVIYGSALYAASGLLFPLPAAVLVNLMGTVIMVSIPYSVGAANGGGDAGKSVPQAPQGGDAEEPAGGKRFLFRAAGAAAGGAARGSGGGLYGGLWGEISRVSGRERCWACCLP